MSLKLLVIIVFSTSNFSNAMLPLYKLTGEENKEIASICGRLTKNNEKTHNGLPCFTTLSDHGPIVELGWQQNRNPMFITKYPTMGAWDEKFTTAGNKNVALYYSYFNWILLQTNDDISTAIDTAKWWREGRIRPICMVDSETKPEPKDIVAFGFDKSKNFNDNVCFQQSNNTVFDCVQKNDHDICINALNNEDLHGNGTPKTEGGGWQWVLPKSRRNALHAMALFIDHSGNILYGTKLKTLAFTKWVKKWTNLTVFHDKVEQINRTDVIKVSLNTVTTVNATCSTSKRKMNCTYTVTSKLAVKANVGPKNRKMTPVSLIVDTGSSRSWVFNRDTKLFINGRRATWSEIYHGPAAYPPDYTPSKHNRGKQENVPYAKLGYGSLYYYKNQVVEIDDKQTDMHLGLMVTWDQKKGVTFGATGILGLGLYENGKDRENWYINQFQSQHKYAEPIVYFDINFANGSPQDSFLFVGGSDAPAGGVLLPIVSRIDGKWSVTADMIIITFPGKAAWVGQYAIGHLDTGSHRIVIPHDIFEEIKMEGKVKHPEKYETPDLKFKCNEIMSYLPKVELKFHGKEQSKATVVVEEEKMYLRFTDPKTKKESCTLNIVAEHNYYFTYGVPVFASSHIQFDYIANMIYIAPK